MKKLKSKLKQLRVIEVPAKIKKEEKVENDEEPIQPSEEEIKKYHMQILEENNRNLLWAIIKNLKFGTEIRHIRLPLFLLKPVSLLEHYTELFYRPDLLAEGARNPDPEKRFLSVVRYYMSLWRTTPTWKKPFNPVIGEVFKCTIKNSTCEANYVAEQLSHHPMKTGVFYCDKENGVMANGYIHADYFRFWGNTTETKLKGGIKIVFVGPDYEEEYNINFPNFGVRGILVGALMTDLWGSVKVECKETGFVAEIDFKSKGLLRGTYHEIEGKIKKGGITLYKFSGLYDGNIELTKLENNEVTALLNVDQYPIADRLVRDLLEQEPNESRRLWNRVIAGIIRSNDDDAWKEKTRLEDKQRKEEAEREAKKIEWKPALFKKADKDGWIYSQWDVILDEIRMKVRERRLTIS